MSLGTEGPLFGDVDWADHDDGGVRVGARLATAVVGVAGILVLLVYDSLMVEPKHPTFGWWDVARIDWLAMLAVVVFVALVGVPVAQDPGLVRAFWNRYPKDALSLIALAGVLAFVVVGAVGPMLVAEPEMAIMENDQPPVFTTVDSDLVFNCIGTESGGQCHGTWKYPLGTTHGGFDVVSLLVFGTRTSLMLAVITSAILVPVATSVGTTAAYVGGRVDAVVSRYIDVQQTVPGFLIYLIAGFLYGRSLFLMVLVFGLLNWGGVARTVRSEALKQKEAIFVDASRIAGGSPLHVIRHHLVPNVTNTVLTAMTLQIPTLIIVEATLSFLDYGDPLRISWGNVISMGADPLYLAMHWWVAGIPTIALVGAALSFNLFGDALQTALDPRQE